MTIRIASEKTMSSARFSARFQPRSAIVRTCTIGRPPRSPMLSSLFVISWKVSG